MTDLETLREANTQLHRRCQLAEAALPQWQEVLAALRAGGGITSFARGLLGWALLQAKEQLEAALAGESAALEEVARLRERE